MSSRCTAVTAQLPHADGGEGGSVGAARAPWTSTHTRARAAKTEVAASSACALRSTALLEGQDDIEILPPARERTRSS